MKTPGEGCASTLMAKASLLNKKLMSFVLHSIQEGSYGNRQIENENFESIK
jgi:hypothetical protein